MSHEFYNKDSQPDPRKAQDVTRVIYAYKMMIAFSGVADWLAGGNAPESNLNFPSLRGETLAAGDELPATHIAVARINRAQQLLEADQTAPRKTFNNEVHRRAVEQLSYIEAIMGRIDPDYASPLIFSFNDINEGLAYYDRETAPDLSSPDGEMMQQNNILAAARLAAETYVIASMEEI